MFPRVHATSPVEQPPALSTDRTFNTSHSVLSTGDAGSSSGSGHIATANAFASSSSGKFDGAMEMYHQSMAARRRRMSMSSSSSMRLHDRSDGGGGIAGSPEDMNTTAQTSSTSLRGPQLRPSTRITRVTPTSTSTVRFSSPPRLHLLPDVSNSGVTPASGAAVTASPDSAAVGGAARPTTTTTTPPETTASLPSANPIVPRRLSRRPLPVITSVTRLGHTPEEEQAGRTTSAWRGGARPVHDDAGDKDSARRGLGSDCLTATLGSSSLLSTRSGWESAADATEKDTRPAPPLPSPPQRHPQQQQQQQQQQRKEGDDDDDGGGRHMTLSESYDGGIYNYLDHPRASTPESRLPSPTPSFHDMISGSYDMPALGSSIADLIHEAPPPPPPPTSAAAPNTRRTHTPAPSASTSLRLSSSLLADPPEPSAATMVLRPPAPEDSPGDRRRSYPLAHARSAAPALTPSEGSSSGSAVQALTRATASASNLKRSGAPAPPLMPPSLDAAVAASSTAPPPPPLPPPPPPLDESSTTTAQFYSTASLAKTFDGAQFLNDYILLNEIGSGATGRVVLAFSTSMNKSVAIKIIPKPKERKYRLQRRASPSPSPSTSVSVAGSRGVGGFSGGAAAATPRAMRSSKPPSSLAAAASTSASAGVHGKRGVSAPSPLTTAERKTRNLQREIEVMKDLYHPNIVRLYEVINDPKANSLFLILQYVDSGAVAQLDSTGRIRAPLPPWTLLPIAVQVSDGLLYLHEQHIVHRDIKPENILVRRDGQAFLADFGVAELISAEEDQPTAATLAYQGTPLFMAPEVYADDDDEDDDDDITEALNIASRHTRRRSSGGGGGGGGARSGGASAASASAAAAAEQSRSMVPNIARSCAARGPRTIVPAALDVWALGVTFYTLLVGCVPFTSMLQIRQTLRRGVDVPHSVPEPWRYVLRRTMEPLQELRITSADLCSLLHKMLAEQEAAEATTGALGRKGSRSTRSRSATLGSRRANSHRSRTGSRSARSVSLVAAVEEEESVNLGSSSSSSSGDSSSSGSTSEGSTGSSSGDDDADESDSSCSDRSETNNGHGTRDLGLSLTSSVLNILRPTNVHKGQ